MAKVLNPRPGEYKQTVPYTKEDQKKDLNTYKERKAEQEKIKEERFAKIEERRKGTNRNRNSGGGINIEITGDK